MRILILTLLGSASIASANPTGERCQRIRAEINLTDGTIRGNFHLDGTVAFAQDSAGVVPSTAPAGSSVFSGLLTIETDHGALVMRETGMFSSRSGNPRGAVLYSVGETLRGTGRYIGVTGDVFFAGRSEGELFLVDVTGELCRPAR